MDATGVSQGRVCVAAHCGSLWGCHWQAGACAAAQDSRARSSSPSTPPPGREVEVPAHRADPGRHPLDAVELAEDSFWLPRRLVGHGALFMLRFKGDSMTRLRSPR